LFLSAKHGYSPPVDEVRELVAYVRGHRAGDPGQPFEVVLGGASPTKTADARDLLGPLIEASASWWDERRPIDDEIDRLEPVSPPHRGRSTNPLGTRRSTTGRRASPPNERAG
jgi:hypothetical protein